MKLLLILALLFSDPETGELKLTGQLELDPIQCINRAKDINDSIARQGIANTVAVCIIDMKGEKV